jgi:type I restriction enzyme R subunit
MGAVEQVLDESIEAQGYIIQESRAIDLSQIDFEALAKTFKQGRKHTIVEKLQAAVALRVAHLLEANRYRFDYHTRFQEMIEEYNAGSVNVDEFFRRLRAFSTELAAEEQRHIAEGLSEEELAVFDILTKPEPELSETERKQVKKVARELLVTLEGRVLVLDWRKHQNTKAAVRVAIEQQLDNLPLVYEKPVYETKCESVYQHVYEAYST